MLPLCLGSLFERLVLRFVYRQRVQQVKLAALVRSLDCVTGDFASSLAEHIEKRLAETNNEKLKPRDFRNPDRLMRTVDCTIQDIYVEV